MHSLLPTRDAKVELDWDLLGRRQASRAFAPGHQPQHFPWSEDSHRNTAPLHQCVRPKPPNDSAPWGRVPGYSIAYFAYPERLGTLD